jgi:hypothetical protein
MASKQAWPTPLYADTFARTADQCKFDRQSSRKDYEGHVTTAPTVGTTQNVTPSSGTLPLVLHWKANTNERECGPKLEDNNTCEQQALSL